MFFIPSNKQTKHRVPSIIEYIFAFTLVSGLLVQIPPVAYIKCDYSIILQYFVQRCNIDLETPSILLQTFLLIVADTNLTFCVLE